jgi:hypothetical protein
MVRVRVFIGIRECVVENVWSHPSVVLVGCESKLILLFFGVILHLSHD